MTYPMLALSTVSRLEPLADARGVSRVARGPGGFLPAYRQAGGSRTKLPDAWKRKRDGFIARHLAQVQDNDEPLWETSGRWEGSPTRRHLALAMWAYSPDAAQLAAFARTVEAA